MRTADGVEIVNGLRVWTNNVRRATVDLEYGTPWKEREWWFYVHEERDDDGSPGYRGVIMSETRVSTRHPSTGERA
jgi:hypothetical protein